MNPTIVLHSGLLWIGIVGYLVMAVIRQVTDILIALVQNRARYEMARQIAALQATQAQHGERLQNVEKAAQSALLNTPPPDAKC